MISKQALEAAVSAVIGDDCRAEGEPMIREALEAAYPYIELQILTEQRDKMIYEAATELRESGVDAESVERFVIGMKGGYDEA